MEKKRRWRRSDRNRTDGRSLDGKSSSVSPSNWNSDGWFGPSLWPSFQVKLDKGIKPKALWVQEINMRRNSWVYRLWSVYKTNRYFVFRWVTQRSNTTEVELNYNMKHTLASTSTPLIRTLIQFLSLVFLAPLTMLIHKRRGKPTRCLVTNHSA